MSEYKHGTYGEYAERQSAASRQQAAWLLND